ncbi:MAG: Uma2 family endonuclease [Clostridiales bacterium]|nr:Uma2 family endonuclease [Clostridiales bacterium]
MLSEAELAYEYIPEEEGEFYRTGKYTLRDYYAIPQERRVELIDGHIYDMAAPGTVHQFAVAEITFQLNLYVRSKGGNCRVYPSPIDVQLDCDDKTMVQPDVAVICDRDKIIKRCVYGAPDLVVEILSDSTAYKDAVVKLCKYMQAGVREYWIVDLKREKVAVYDATGGSRAGINGADINVEVENEAATNEAGANVPDGNRAGISSRTTIYGMDQPIPVRIFDGDCQISFDEIREEARRILNPSQEDE